MFSRVFEGKGWLLVVFAAGACACGIFAGEAAEEFPPYVVKTVPADREAAVRCDLREIKVTFDRPMDTGSWSWIIHQDLGEYPGIQGGPRPRWEDDGRTCVLHVNLRPDTVYAVGANSVRHGGFRDRNGNKAVPCVWVFRAGRQPGGDGRAIGGAPRSADAISLAGAEGPKVPSVSVPGAENPFRKDGRASFAAYSEDGRLIAAAHSDGAIRIWNAETGAGIARLKGETEGIVSAVFSPDSGKLATLNREGTVHVWDAKRGASLFRVGGDKFGALSTGFSPDGKCLATMGRDNTLYIWHSTTGAQRLRILNVSGGTGSIAFSKEGALLAVLGTDGLVSLWEIETGRQRFRFRGMGGDVVSFLFSPDSNSLNIVNDRNQMHVWDVKTGVQRFRVLDVESGDKPALF